MWHEFRRAQAKRKKVAAVRAKERAEDARTRNEAALVKAAARQLWAVERQRKRAAKTAQRQAQAARYQARVAAAAPVVRVVPARVTGGPAMAVNPATGRPVAAAKLAAADWQSAALCRAPTDDGTPCQNKILPGTSSCSAGHRTRSGAPRCTCCGGDHGRSMRRGEHCDGCRGHRR
jgi:hypothetical protein